LYPYHVAKLGAMHQRQADPQLLTIYIGFR
jgi:hypothetical protein